MKSKLVKLMAEQYGVTEESITDDTNILYLGADSLDLVETQVSIERECDIETSPDDYKNTTINGLLTMIESKINNSLN